MIAMNLVTPKAAAESSTTKCDVKHANDCYKICHANRELLFNKVASDVYSMAGLLNI
jgi:hypothetical protein